MFGLSWLSPTLLGALGIAIIAAAVGGWATHKYDGIALSHAQTQTSQARAALSDYRASVAADAAKANAAALAQKTASDATIQALQAQLRTQQEAADAKSKSLLALLNAAKPGDIRPLGPVALSYYQRLRGNAPTATAGTNPGH